MADLQTEALYYRVRDTTEQTMLGLDRHDDMLRLTNLWQDPKLSDERCKALFDRIEDGLLAEVASDIDGGSLGVGALSVDEKRDLFSAFVHRLDGAQLARLARVMHTSGNLDLLAEEVAKSPPEQRLGFVRAMAPETTRKDREDTQTSTRAVRFCDADARAVAIVLASLRRPHGDTLSAAIRDLDGAQLQAVMHAGAGVEAIQVPDPEGPQAIVGARPTLFADVLDASSGAASDAKARLFTAGALDLGTFGKWDSKGVAVMALGRLIDSDAPGVLRALREQGTPAGERSALTLYAAERLRREGDRAYDAFARHTEQLCREGGVAFLSRSVASPDGQEYRYPNALDAAGLVGAVIAASQASNNEKAQVQDVIQNLATTTSLAVNAFGAKALSASLRGGIVLIGGAGRDLAMQWARHEQSGARAARSNFLTHDPASSVRTLGETPAWPTFVAETLRIVRENQ